MTNISEERLRQLYDENFFYEYGANPNLKHLIQLMQENTTYGLTPVHRTLVMGASKRWFPFRDYNDFVERHLQCHTFVRAAGLLVIATGITWNCYRNFRFLIPVGKYGYTRISQVPFVKYWGKLGVAFAFSLPIVSGYFWLLTLKFTAIKFWKHVVLQERNWKHEYLKFTNMNADYAFRDSPMSATQNMPADAQLLMAQKTVQKPRFWLSKTTD